MKKQFKVEGMSCNHCKMAVTKALMNDDRITEVDVNLESKVVEIHTDSDIDMQEIKRIVDEAGYTVID
jgi:copper chaperone